MYTYLYYYHNKYTLAFPAYYYIYYSRVISYPSFVYIKYLFMGTNIRSTRCLLRVKIYVPLGVYLWVKLYVPLGVYLWVKIYVPLSVIYG